MIIVYIRSRVQPFAGPIACLYSVRFPSKVPKAEAQAVQDGTNQDLVHTGVAWYPTPEPYTSRGILGYKPFTDVVNDVAQPSRDLEGKGHRSLVYGVSVNALLVFMPFLFPA